MKKNLKIKNSKKGFTLIELLVVVAIIGVLAAVGVTAFQGFTENAKVNAMKTMHANVVKRIAAEFQKCTMGATTFFVGTRKTNGASVSRNCQTNSTNQAAQGLAGIVDISSDKNPFQPSLSNGNPNWAVRSRGGFSKGFVNIQRSGNRLFIRTLWNDSNQARYRAQDVVQAE